MNNIDWLNTLSDVEVRVVANRWSISDYMTRSIDSLKKVLVELEGLQETPMRREETYTDRLLNYWKPELMHVLYTATHRAGAEGKVCNDIVEMSAIIEAGLFKRLEFFSMGCCISQCSAAMLVEYFRGKTIEEAAQFSEKDMLDLVGIKITKAREGCVLVALDCLRNLCGSTKV